MAARRVAFPALTLLSCAALIAGASLTAREGRVAHDLRASFAEGDKYEIRTGFKMSLNLDDAEMKFGEMTLPQTPTVNVNVAADETSNEEVKKVKDGVIQELVRVYDDNAVKVTGQAGMGEQMQDLDEEEANPLSGRKLKIVRTDEGLEITDLSNEGKPADEQLEELTAEQKAGVDLESHFEYLLPTKAVEVGDSWDIGKPFAEKMTKMMTASASAQEDEEAGEMMKEVFSTVMQNMESTATGKLESVEGDIANIAYAIDAKMKFDDFAKILEKLGENAEEMPEDMSGEVVMTLKMKGTGKFDMKARQMKDLEMGGDFGLDLKMNMSQQGMEVSIAGKMSGSMEMSGGITKK
jgi:hypothetical protein